MTNAIHDLLEQHFYTAFAAPDGVAKLRELILTLAMQGKLVEQEPTDQPASELLNEIEAEKQRLVKADKIKAPKPLQPIKPEEVPYELPQGWVWVRLGEIGVINPRNDAVDSAKAGFVPMSMIPEGYSEKHQFEECPWSEIKKGYTHFADGDIGMAKITPCFENGKSCVFSELPNGIGAGTTELHIFRNLFHSVVPRFLLYYLKNPHYIAKAVPNMTGSAGQKRVPTPYFTNQPFPLPPLPEQHRIVARIDQLMTRCDVLEILRKEREEKRLAVHAASIQQLLAAPSGTAWDFIEQHFNELHSVKENVAELRKAILQLAVMGKLVPQDPSDSPARELLNEIEAEKKQLVKTGKIKASKPLPKITAAEMPYALPEGWQWCYLQDIFAVITDGDHQAPPRADSGIPFLVIGNLNTGTINLESSRFVPDTYYCSLDWSKTPAFGDVLYTVTGSFGIPIYVDVKDRFCVQRHVAILKSSESTPTPYIARTLKSKSAFQFATSIATGIAQKTVPLTGLRQMPVALPPKAEQTRIVARIDQLMGLCDTLDQKIVTATAKKNELLNAVMAKV